MPVGNSSLKALVELCPEYTEGSRETRGDPPPCCSSSPLCLFVTSITFLVGRERSLEGGGCFISAVTASLSVSGMLRRGQLCHKKPTVPSQVPHSLKVPHDHAEQGHSGKKGPVNCQKLPCHTRTSFYCFQHRTSATHQGDVVLQDPRTLNWFQNVNYRL